MRERWPSKMGKVEFVKELIELSKCFLNCICFFGSALARVQQRHRSALVRHDRLFPLPSGNLP